MHHMMKATMAHSVTPETSLVIRDVFLKNKADRATKKV
jgi:hypothetical protein